jgi:hypothetical protein
LACGLPLSHNIFAPPGPSQEILELCKKRIFSWFTIILGDSRVYKIFISIEKINYSNNYKPDTLSLRPKEGIPLYDY